MYVTEDGMYVHAWAGEEKQHRVRELQQRWVSHGVGSHAVQTKQQHGSQQFLQVCGV
jgi:hypothetical protein